MKILCEVPLKVANYLESRFHWLKHNDSLLFVVENGQRLRILNIKQDPIEDVQTASLTESRLCTHCCWNRDNSLLAIVVDKRQIYFWQVKTNQFTQFKSLQQQQQHQQQQSAASNSHQVSSSNSSAAQSSTSTSSSIATRKTRHKDIELVAWSKLTDKLAVCYATGQILLCRFAKNYSNLTEKFIDNSESVLKRIVSIEVADQADLFACFSSISEILVMTFDGQTKFYIQGDGLNLFNAKFSPKFLVQQSGPFAPRDHRNQANYLQANLETFGSPHEAAAAATTTAAAAASICLAYQSKSDGLFFKRIAFDNSEFQDIKPKLDILHDKDYEDSRLVDFFWLTPSRLLACLSTGTILMAQLVFGQSKYPQQHHHHQQPPARDPTFSLVWSELLRIRPAQDGGDPMQFGGPSSPPPQPDVASQDSRDGGSLASLARSASSASGGGGGGVGGPSKQVTFKDQEDEDQEELEFVAFDVASSQSAQRRGHEFAFVAATKYKLYYYELYENDDHASQRGHLKSKHHQQQQHLWQFEPVDELDLADSLRRWRLSVVRVSWSNECSLLAVQLTSGHILVYRARLPHQLVASCGSRTAYLSSSSEVTILNYGASNPSATNDNTGSSPTNGPLAASPATSEPANETNAIILDVGLRPSVLAVGPRHLAVALNNRVRFYPLGGLVNHSADANSNEQQQQHHHELEFASIVVGIKLNSSFVALQFDDGRLKLQAAVQAPTSRPPSGATKSNELPPQRLLIDDERFFPDPVRPETIVAFALTEQLLVYCSRERQIQVFSLRQWATVQTCDHGHLFGAPVRQLTCNEAGNKFVCLVAGEPGSSGAYLYDVYSNQVYSLVGGGEAHGEPEANVLSYEQIFQSQLEQTLALLPLNSDANSRSWLWRRGRPAPTGAQLLDAIWDTDGRTVLLIERDLVHVVAILDHTLASGGGGGGDGGGSDRPVAEYADWAPKPASYRILYASQGIVSYQTKLGRVINSILATHNDDLKLLRLEQQVARLLEARASSGGGGGEPEPAANERLALRWDVMQLKLAYLRTILPLYSLPKCYDICDHLMGAEQFGNSTAAAASPEAAGASATADRGLAGLIDQLIWRQLAAWSVYCSNLDFAQLIYRKHHLLVQGQLLARLLDDWRWRGLDSRRSIRRQLVSHVLGMEAEAEAETEDDHS